MRFKVDVRSKDPGIWISHIQVPIFPIPGSLYPIFRIPDPISNIPYPESHAALRVNVKLMRSAARIDRDRLFLISYQYTAYLIRWKTLSI